MLDKRQFRRIEFDSLVILSQSNTSWTAKLTDISLQGLLVEMPEAWQSASGQFEASVKIPEHTISMTVEKIHEENKNIGFKCTAIELDSVTNLKRLVELNLGDETLLEREISAMIQN